jgi:hypothetical protein
VTPALFSRDSYLILAVKITAHAGQQSDRQTPKPLRTSALYAIAALMARNTDVP